MEKPIGNARKLLSRRQLLAGAAGLGAIAIASKLGTAFAGDGGSGDGGGASSTFVWAPQGFTFWYDSLLGEKQGHTPNSNYAFWNDYVEKKLESMGYSFVYGGRDGQAADGIFEFTAGMPQVMNEAMNNALTRNGQKHDAEAEHARIVGISFAAIQPDNRVGTKVLVGHDGNYYDSSWYGSNGEKHLDAFFPFTRANIKPGLDSATETGMLPSSAGWTQARINEVWSIGRQDQYSYASRYVNGVRYIVWAVSDLTLPVNGTISIDKKSANPEMTDDNENYTWAGVKFDIIDESTGKKVAEMTCNDAGHAQCEVKQGTYTIAESDPKGWMKPIKPITGVVVKANETTKVGSIAGQYFWGPNS